MLPKEMPDYERMTREELEDAYHDLCAHLECVSKESSIYWELKEEIAMVEGIMDEKLSRGDEEGGE